MEYVEGPKAREQVEAPSIYTNEQLVADLFGTDEPVQPEVAQTATILADQAAFWIHENVQQGTPRDIGCVLAAACDKRVENIPLGAQELYNTSFYTAEDPSQYFERCVDQYVFSFVLPAREHAGDATFLSQYFSDDGGPMIAHVFEKPTWWVDKIRWYVEMQKSALGKSGFSNCEDRWNNVVGVLNGSSPYLSEIKRAQLFGLIVGNMEMDAVERNLASQNDKEAVEDWLHKRAAIENLIGAYKPRKESVILRVLWNMKAGYNPSGIQDAFMKIIQEHRLAGM